MTYETTSSNSGGEDMIAEATIQRLRLESMGFDAEFALKVAIKTVFTKLKNPAAADDGNPNA